MLATFADKTDTTVFLKRRLLTTQDVHGLMLRRFNIKIMAPKTEVDFTASSVIHLMPHCYLSSRYRTPEPRRFNLDRRDGDNQQQVLIHPNATTLILAPAGVSVPVCTLLIGVSSSPLRVLRGLSNFPGRSTQTEMR